MSTFADSRKLYLRLLRYVKPYRSRFAWVVVAMIVLAISQAGFAALLQPLIDEGFSGQDSDARLWIPAMILGVALARGISSYASSYGMAWIANSVVNDLRNQMFQRLMVIPIPFYDNNPSGNLISKVTYDANQVTNAATNALTILVRDTVTIIGLLGWMIFLNWKLSLTALALIPVVGITAHIVGKRMRHLATIMQEKMAQMTHHLSESIKGIRVVRIFGGQTQEAKRFALAVKQARQTETKFTSASATNTSVVEFAGAAALAALVYLGAALAEVGEVTPGGFVSFVTAMGLLFTPIKKLTSVNALLQRGLAASSSIFEVLDQAIEPDQGVQRQVQRFNGNVTFDKVTFRYQPDTEPALKEVSFVAAAGKTTALVGPSGGGKSTIANLLPRFYEVSAGCVLLDDTDITSISLSELRSQISSVSQEPVLFNDTIAANIAYGMQPKPKEQAIREAARKAHALEFIDQLPQGLNTTVGENGVRLSGGQRQRIAIARALLKDAPLLILDEATSALDSTSEKNVQAAFDNLEAGRTTLVIAHRLSTIEKADHIIVLDKGQIVEQGTHTELMLANGLYQNLYQTQFKHPAD